MDEHKADSPKRDINEGALVMVSPQSAESVMVVSLPRLAETFNITLESEDVPENVEGDKHDKAIEPAEKKKYFEKETQMPEDKQVTRLPEYVIRHAIGEKLMVEHIVEAQNFAERLRYPSVATIFSGGEDEYLYYCPDKLETETCRYMEKTLSFQSFRVD